MLEKARAKNKKPKSSAGISSIPNITVGTQVSLEIGTLYGRFWTNSSLLTLDVLYSLFWIPISSVLTQVFTIKFCKCVHDIYFFNWFLDRCVWEVIPFTTLVQWPSLWVLGSPKWVCSWSLSGTWTTVAGFSCALLKASRTWRRPPRPRKSSQFHFVLKKTLFCYWEYYCQITCWQHEHGCILKLALQYAMNHKGIFNCVGFSM